MRPAPPHRENDSQPLLPATPPEWYEGGQLQSRLFLIWCLKREQHSLGLQNNTFTAEEKAVEVLAYFWCGESTSMPVNTRALAILVAKQYYNFNQPTALARINPVKIEWLSISKPKTEQTEVPTIYNLYSPVKVHTLIFPLCKRTVTPLTQGDMLEITKLIRNTFFWVESSNHLFKMGVLRWVWEGSGKGAQSLSKPTNRPANQPTEAR